VAATRPVSDAAAKALALALHRHGGYRPEITAVRALHDAQLELAPESDAWSFRALVP
jgi:hypothetical protein